ncbi:MAG: hypothetical protein B6243_00325 [Anaerolineaceae bacterium 4572_5.2]|nr:MAG: hypothetical protein B6243_00325 [Anaerolineaceae bacterium 4572_5.2]
MPDFSPKTPSIHQYAPLPNLDLGPDLITPQYGGGSIANLADSVCQLLDVPTLGIGPLGDKLLSPVGEGVKRVVLVLVDALSYNHFCRWGEGIAPIWRDLVLKGTLAPITSITPSTTDAALTSLWTGQAPAKHGILGFEVWLKQYSMVANLLFHAPASFRGPHGSLEQTGFDPEKFLPVPTLGPHLRAHGVEPYAFQHRNILKSGLSSTFLAEANLEGIGSPSELWVNLRELLEENPHQRLYAYAYWGLVDTLFHLYGTDNERPAAEFASFSTNFERFFLSKLSQQAKKDTVLILTADHGQVYTPPNPHREIKNHPQLVNMLSMLPSGENRCTYFYVRPGQKENVRTYIEEHWPNDFLVIDSEKALQAGLFGPAPHHADAHNRVGDLIALAKKDAYFWWADKRNHLLGRHGGLAAQEMIVPFLAVRLDA